MEIKSIFELSKKQTLEVRPPGTKSKTVIFKAKIPFEEIPEEKRLQIKEDKNGEGIIEGYVSVFETVDSYGEVVKKGAFTQAVKDFKEKGRFPKILWCHKWDELLGKTLEMKEDDYGLWVKGKLTMEVQRAREAFHLVKDGAQTDFSIGYTVKSYEVIEEDQEDNSKKRIINLTDVKLYEWSFVMAGANPDTEITGYKSEGEQAKPEKKTVVGIDVKDAQEGAKDLVVKWSDETEVSFNLSEEVVKSLMFIPAQKARDVLSLIERIKEQANDMAESIKVIEHIKPDSEEKGEKSVLKFYVKNIEKNTHKLRAKIK